MARSCRRPVGSRRFFRGGPAEFSAGRAAAADAAGRRVVRPTVLRALAWRSRPGARPHRHTRDQIRSARHQPYLRPRSWRLCVSGRDAPRRRHDPAHLVGASARSSRTKGGCIPHNHRKDRDHSRNRRHRDGGARDQNPDAALFENRTARQGSFDKGGGRSETSPDHGAGCRAASAPSARARRLLPIENW